ncbi:MAG: hypothetical protein AABY15_08060 [Nanoarchaeota archaeon]
MTEKTLEQRTQEAKEKGIPGKISAYCERCKTDTVYVYAYTQPHLNILPEDVFMYDCMSCDGGIRITLSSQTLIEKMNGKVIE